MVEDVDTSLIDHAKNKLSQNGLLNGVIHPKNKAHQNGNVKREDDDFEPPDGGVKAMLVLLGSFVTNGILFGIINSYSVLYSEFHEDLKRRNVSDASGKAALVGSLAMGTTFFISPVSGVLTDFIGIRMTTFIGGAIATTGMLLASFCTENIIGLCVTFGVMFGLGGALAYTPSLAVLGHYFKRYLGIVNGLVTTGSSIFTISMPYIISICLKRVNVVWTLRILALISSFIMVFAFLFKPSKKNSKPKLKKIAMDDIFKTEVLRNKRFLTWAIVIALSLFGYFIPYVYMIEFVKAKFGTEVDGKIPVLCIGISSGVGRLLFGFIADHPKINRIMLQQLSFLVIGLMTMLLPISTNSFGLLVVITLCLGLFDGCFITTIGPIAFDICGQSGATQAIGFMLGCCSIPLTIGPYVAGLLIDHQKSFTMAMILAGIPPIFGSVAMFLIRCLPEEVQTKVPEQDPLKSLQKNVSNLTQQEDLLEKEDIAAV